MEKETMYQTECMKAIVGIPEKYKYISEQDIEGYISYSLIDYVNEIEKRTGIYISIETNITRVHYKNEWGCPNEVTGERCVCIQALRNPKFMNNSVIWKNACIELMKLIKDEWKQSTISVQFFNTDMFYLYTENENE